MDLENYGYNSDIEEYIKEQNLDNFEIGRVIAEHKERYFVKTKKGDFEAEITGNLRFTAQSREDFPAVGDWVALNLYDSNFAIIHEILPRYSVLKRQAVGEFGKIQVIAVNIDYAFLVQAVDRDFNSNRLERYLTICNSSKIKPIVLLTKIDKREKKEIDEIVEYLNIRLENIPVFAISNLTQEGYSNIWETLVKGKTYCLLGSSGVGKSSLINNLSGESVMKTDIISESTQKGKHVTTHRELILIRNGSLLIDNPGMREVGITDTENGLEITFDKIVQYSGKCKYKDCTHTVEKGCSVIEAVKNGEIDEKSYENYLKIERERSFFESSLLERKKKEKDLGKLLKNYKKDINRNDM